MIVVEQAQHPLLEALESLKLPAGHCPPHVQVVPLSSVKRLISQPLSAESEGGETD